MQDTLQRLFQYKAWANDELLTALAKLGGGPDAVAKVVEKAITARKPSIRYRVTPSAHLAIGQRRLMTAGMWDAMLRTQFPQPGKKR